MRVSLHLMLLVLFFSASAVSAATPVGAGGDIQQVFNKLSRDLQCLCGCNATIANCPHSDCGYAVPARKKIRSLLRQDKSYDEVIAYFVKKEGEVALAAPSKKGFNLFGYAMPFIAIAAAGSGVAFTASRWAKKGSARAESMLSSPSPEEASGELAEKLKKELEDFQA